MVKRKLATVTASLALLIPAGALALGLGNISMNSALDQHLKAEIPIQSATAEDLEGLEVNLAPDAMFAQYGIERPAFLDGLQFEIVRGADGQDYIQLSSSKPIREPFLNFLVEAKWPSGHALRQFTVLVDPPTMMAAAPVQVAPARVPVSPPVRQGSADASQSLLSTDNSSGAIEYGPSRANDTLWGVANAMRGNRDVSIHQVMLAVLRDNPDAFYRNNVNNLKMGYVLRINDPASLTSISRAEAEREISRQYQDWKNDRTGSSATASAVAESSATEESVQSSAAGSVDELAAANQAESAQLKLTSAGKTDQSQAQGEATSAAIDGVNERLAIANEQLLANHQETTALTERLGKLEGQLESLQRLVQLKDNQLAEIQQRAKEAPAAAAPVTQTEPVAEGLFDSPLALGLIALVLGLIAALGYVLFQRRQQAEYQESILDQTAAPVSEIPTDTTTETSTVASSSIDQNDSESSLLTDFSTTSMEGLQSDIGEIDPISEADVYLAYGRYTQAEEIIENALKNDADREEYHTKLLEIYHAADEKEKFLGAAQRYHGVLGGNLLGDGWVKVCAMGREIQPDNALFSGDGTAADEHDVAESDYFPDEVETPASELADNLSSEDNRSELEAPTDEKLQDELDSFDFNALDEKLDQLDERSLDDPFTELESDSSVTAESSTPEDSNSLEFDSGSLEALNAEKLGDEGSENQQLDDDIASNTLDFGSDDVAEEKSDESGIAGDEVSVAESLDADTIDSVTDDSLTTTENDDFEFTSIQDEATTELNLDTDTADTVDVAEETEKTDVDSFNFEDLEKLESENKSTETDAGVESDLLDMANALDDVTSDEPEARKDDDKLENFDLGSIVDLTDDNSDYDDDNPFSDLDEVGTKLDLARAYVDMGDKEGAQSIVDEVMQEGTDEQKEEAQELLKQL